MYNESFDVYLWPALMLIVSVVIKHLARKIICFLRSVELHEKTLRLSSKNICSTNWRHLSIYEK
ncbi:hypothetical protein E2X65_23345 [Salmonella enterica]|nr:hypothetical protein [Salmonella enterica]